MARLRTLFGDELLGIFAQFGFVRHSQRGSHIKLRRASADGRRETLTIVAHRDVDKGTLQAIFCQASHYIPPAQLAPDFYGD